MMSYALTISLTLLYSVKFSNAEDLFSALTPNFPEYLHSSKRCAQVKYTVHYQRQICAPDGKGGFTKESEDNCCYQLKNECPEFNEAKCLWYTWKPVNTSCKNQNQELEIPCCRLKYYAATSFSNKYTWMEVLYANQYGTSDYSNTVYDVVEIHRLIKNHDSFGKNDAPDWPHNVADSHSERGLPWTEVKNNTPFPDTIKTVCVNGIDTNETCAKDIRIYLSENYKEGFEHGRVPKNTGFENMYKAVTGIEYLTTCTKILIDWKKTDACKVMYMKRVKYSYERPSKGQDHLIKVDETKDYLEAQIYKKDGLKLRYGYYAYKELKP